MQTVRNTVLSSQTHLHRQETVECLVTAAVQLGEARAVAAVAPYRSDELHALETR